MRETARVGSRYRAGHRCRLDCPQRSGSADGRVQRSSIADASSSQSWGVEAWRAIAIFTMEVLTMLERS